MKGSCKIPLRLTINQADVKKTSTFQTDNIKYVKYLVLSIMFCLTFDIHLIKGRAESCPCPTNVSHHPKEAKESVNLTFYFSKTIIFLKTVMKIIQIFESLDARTQYESRRQGPWVGQPFFCLIISTPL